MRLYLLPISTRRTLLYAQRLNATTTDKQTWMDKIQDRAAKLWADWESKEKGWQKSVVNYGNYAFRRIPYQEWGLKSVPPMSKRRKEEELKRTDRVEVVFPKILIPQDRVPSVLAKLATEREAFHRQRMTWCFIGMPLTAPIAVIPLVPNLPFFYLVYRAWSHWRALSGGKHIQFLLKNNLLNYAPSPIVDRVYASQAHPLPSTPEPTTSSGADQVKPLAASSPIAAVAAVPKQHVEEGETMLLSQANGKKMAHALELPQLEVEIERAIWQVEQAIQKQNAELVKKTKGSAPPAATADAKARESSDATGKEEKKSQ